MFHQGRILYTTKTIRGKTFINIWITKVKLFWKKRGVGILTLQYNSYLSHVRSFWRILYTFLVSLIMTLICLDPCQWSLMSLITGNKVKKNTHLLTFESQKLNYFGKKGGSAFWHYNIIRIWAMSGPFSRFKWPITNYVQKQFSVISSNISMIIMYYEYMTTQYFVRFFLSI
jgi:hypothetical protein